MLMKSKKKYSGILVAYKKARGGSLAGTAPAKFDRGLLVANSTGQPLGPIAPGTRVMVLLANGKRRMVDYEATQKENNA